MSMNGICINDPLPEPDDDTPSGETYWIHPTAANWISMVHFFEVFAASANTEHYA